MQNFARHHERNLRMVKRNAVMHVIFQGLRKSKATSTATEYIVTLRVDGKLRRFHALVSADEICAVSFRETELNDLLAYNMNSDQGRMVYKSVAQLHHEGRKPALPMDLGNWLPFPTLTKPRRRLAKAVA
jgi:hypothetical protein